MLNIIDLVLGIFLGLYLFKNIGGAAKTIKSLASAALILIVFGLLAELIISFSWSEQIQPTVKESFFFQVSHNLIRLVYPAVEKTAPQVDTFIKEKIISQPDAKINTGDISLPAIAIPKDKLPGLKLEDLPKLK